MERQIDQILINAFELLEYLEDLEVKTNKASMYRTMTEREQERIKTLDKIRIKIHQMID